MKTAIKNLFRTKNRRHYYRCTSNAHTIEQRLAKYDLLNRQLRIRQIL